MKVPALKHLTPKHYMWARRYAFHHDKTRAAIEAGFSEKTAGVIGYRLYQQTSVKSLVARYETELWAKYEATDEKIIREYSRLAFSDERNYLSWDSDGVYVKPSADLSEDESAAIKEISIDIETTVLREVEIKRAKFKIKTHDKKSALDALAKLRGMGVGDGDKEMSLSDEEIDRIQRELHDQTRRLIDAPKDDPSDDSSG